MLQSPTRRLSALLLGAVLSLGSSTAFCDAYDLISRLSGNPGFQYHSSPQDWRDVNMYQLFTDRFFDGNNLSRYSTTGSPWYNQSGSNFTALVKPAPSSIRWFGNTIQSCARPPQLGIGTDAGGATNATLVYSTDAGAHWNAAPMHKTSTRGNNDVWTTALGSLPPGITVRYAVEVMDEQGHSLWDNNHSTNFEFQVLAPTP